MKTSHIADPILAAELEADFPDVDYLAKETLAACEEDFANPDLPFEVVAFRESCCDTIRHNLGDGEDGDSIALAAIRRFWDV
jgi:hypothetical protein